jgi:hypothetical protein
MSGDKVATRMTARVEPLADGRKSRVTTSVQRGDAPDDFVSPALRSEGLTLALFALSVEAELNKLTAPPRADAETCARLEAQLLANAGSSSAAAGEPRNALEAIGSTSKTILALHAAEAELRRRGCPTDRTAGRDGEFKMASDTLKNPPMVVEGVNFEPGKPMIVPRPSR